MYYKMFYRFHYMFVNIHSTLQMPRNVPIMTVLNPINVALTVKKIFELSE